MLAYELMIVRGAGAGSRLTLWLQLGNKLKIGYGRDVENFALNCDCR